MKESDIPFLSFFGTKVISVIIAIVLWVIVLGSRTVEVTKEVPIEVITSADMTPSNEVPEKIAFRLSGPKAFLRAVLDRKEEPIRVNLTGSKAGLITYRFFSDNIHVPIGVKVQSINPAAILLKLEPMIHKDVPVRLDMQGSVPEGYKLLRTALKPDVVKIKGPESRVNSVTEVTSSPVNLHAFKQTSEKEIGLELERFGIQIVGALPRLLVEIESNMPNFKLKSIEVKVIGSDNYRLTDKVISVFVRATPEQLKSLDRSQVYAVVDVRGKKPGEYEVAVKVSLPGEITLVRAVPEQVHVRIN